MCAVDVAPWGSWTLASADPEFAATLHLLGAPVIAGRTREFVAGASISGGSMHSRRWQIVCHRHWIGIGTSGPLPAHGRHRGCIYSHRLRLGFFELRLEVVSSSENSLRGNHPLFTVARRERCKRGHDLNDPANVYVRADGRRRCRTCQVEAQRDRRRAKKAGKR